jgi:hypothetical protein
MTAAPDLTPFSNGDFYWFKLEYPDHRWTVQQKLLPSRPSEGDCVDLGDDGQWRVLRTTSVHVRPAGKPDREFFVCIPV